MALTKVNQSTNEITIIKLLQVVVANGASIPGTSAVRHVDCRSENILRGFN